MEIVYRAFDGTIFENEFDCEEYEFKEIIMKRTNIHVYDKQNHLLPKLNFDDNFDTDGKEYKVVIKDEKDLEDIKAACDFTGFYWDINAIGTWIHKKDHNGFLRWVLKEEKK